MGWPPASRLPGALQTLWFLADPTAFLARQSRLHGATFGVRTLMYGDQVFVSDPADLARVFAADPDLVRAGEANTVLRRVVGARSVSSLDGAAHRARRRLLVPALAAAQPPDDHLRRLARESLSSLPSGQSIQIRPALRRLTLDVMRATLFGADDPDDQLASAFARLVDLGSVPLAQLGAMPVLQRDLGPLSPWRAFASTLAQVDGALHARIARRRACPVPGHDMLGAMLRGHDEHGHSLSRDDLRDDLFTLLGAGHETTTTALGWALESILARPSLAARIRHELGSSGESPTLDASLRETLRLYPVLPTVTRRLATPFSLGGHDFHTAADAHGRHDLRAGTDVVLCLYLAQRSPAHHARPDDFLPARFLEPRTTSRPWWPFGGGTRRCPGMGLAMRVMHTTAAVALTEVPLLLASRSPSVPMFRGSTLAPLGGVRVVRTR